MLPLGRGRDAGRQHRRQRERHEERDQHGTRHGHSEVAEEAAQEALDEERGNEDDRDGQRRGGGGEGDAPRAHAGRLEGVEALVALPLDALEHHDGIVDHDAHGERHGHQREAEQPGEAEARHQRERDRRRHDQRGTPAAQEDEDGDHGENRAEPQREPGLADRLADHRRHVDRLVPRRHRQAGGQHLGQLREAPLRGPGDRHGVGVGLLVDADPRDALAAEAGNGAQILSSVLDPGDVAEADLGAVDLADDQPSELLDRVELGIGHHVVLDVLVLEQAARDLDVLPAQGAEYVAHGQAARVKRVAVEPDADRAILRTEERDGRYPRDGLECWLDEAAHVLAGLHDGAVGLDRGPHHRAARVVRLAHDRRIELARQHPAGARDLVPHVLDHDVEVGAELELDHDVGQPGGAGGADRVHAGDGRELLLEDVGDILLHALGRGTLERRAHADDREVHLREVVDAEPAVAHEAEDDEPEHHHPGENRSLNRDVRERHSRVSASSRAATAGVPS